MPRALVLVVALGLVAVACGTDDGTDAGTDAASGTSAAPGTTVAAGGCGLDPAATDLAPPGLSVVVFTRTEGFRHPSIEQAVEVAGWMADDAGWELVATEDPDAVVAALPDADVLVMANTTGDVFDDDEQVVVEGWVREGGAVVGVHAATDTEQGWPFYGEVIGAWTAGHPPGLQEVDLVAEDPDHPATAHLPERSRWVDELYDFDRDPRQGSDVLLTLDESTAVLEPGARPFAMGDDHPIAWTRRIDDGRAFLTNLGHRPETWCDPRFQQHLLGGLAWAVSPPTGPASG